MVYSFGLGWIEFKVFTKVFRRLDHCSMYTRKRKLLGFQQQINIEFQQQSDEITTLTVVKTNRNCLNSNSSCFYTEHKLK